MSIDQDNDSFREQRDILYESAKALGKIRDQANEASKATSKLESIAQKLALDAEETVILSDKNLESLQKQARTQQENLKTAYKRLKAEGNISNLTGEALERAQELLAAGEANFEASDDLNKNIDEQIKAREKANKLLGTSGNILKGLNSIAGNFSKALGLDEVEKKMQSVALKVAKNKESFGKLRVIVAGVGESFKQLGNNLLSPTVLLTNMVLGFNKVDKAATGFQQLTGQNLNTAKVAIGQFNGGLITSAEYIKTASDLTKEFGLNAAAVFTPENLMEAASMTKEMGLAGKEAANLARLSKVNGGNIESQNEAIIDGINSANRQNKTAVSHGMALRDVANASEGIAINYAGYPDKLGEAAAAARALGMDLNKVDAIASSLLKFESSISAELEAELLTGRSLNLEKAREFALMNDMKGVATELANQGITSANFSKMNRIQQEAQAKALGMSRDEMARMLLQQEMNKGLSEGALNNAQKATLEDLKRVDAQEKIATAIGKLQQLLAPVLEIFANIVSHSAFIYSIMGVGLLTKFPLAIKFAKGFANNFKDAFKSVKGLVSGIAKMVTGGGTGRLKAFFRKSQMDGASESTKLSNKAKPGAGKGIKENLQGLAAGLRSMGKGPVLKGVVNLAAFALAGVAAIPSLLFLFPFSALPGKLVKNNMQALAAGLRSFGTGKVMAGIGAFTLLSLAGVLMIPGSVGLLMFGGAAYVAAAGMAVLTPALISLGSAMASGVGALGLAALVVAAVGLGFAFALVGVGALAMGKGIKLAAEGFAIMVPQILSLIPAIPGLFLLGGALMSISAGLATMSVAGLLAMPTILALTALGSVSEGLSSIFGDDEPTSQPSNEMAGVEKKLDTLISLIEKGGDVYIDGSKVGKSLQLASSKVG
tara:strand:- start:6800 stop:9460 length:2661 start_codon:yes stop_codon:yes gene_type:complete